MTTKGEKHSNKVYGSELASKMRSGPVNSNATRLYSKAFPSIPDTAEVSVERRDETFILKIDRPTEVPNDKGNAPSVTGFAYLTKQELISLRDSLTNIIENGE